MQQDWHKAEANNLRIAVSIAFYIFGALLLIACLGSLPQCSQRNADANKVGEVKESATVPQAQVSGAKTEHK